MSSASLRQWKSCRAILQITLNNYSPYQKSWPSKDVPYKVSEVPLKLLSFAENMPPLCFWPVYVLKPPRRSCNI